MRPAPPNTFTLGSAAAPSILALILFYSLAVHMHAELGRWPEMLGETGFSAALKAHAFLATGYFWMWTMALMFIWPIILVACLWPSRRKYLLYVGIHALSFVVVLGLMQMAPGGYRFWWWD
jgi:hypothetical protein